MVEARQVLERGFAEILTSGFTGALLGWLSDPDIWPRYLGRQCSALGPDALKVTHVEGWSLQDKKRVRLPPRPPKQLERPAPARLPGTGIESGLVALMGVLRNRLFCL